jgi:hypothetical protein
MSGPESRLITTDLVRGVERSPDEMLHSSFSRNFKNADPPVDFSFFSDSKSVDIYKGNIDVA